MKRKFYAVSKGRETGIFDTWLECERQVIGYPGAVHASFASRVEAEAALGGAMTGDRTENKLSLTQEVISAIEVDVKIYSDGGCIPNPGEAGSGLAVYEANKLTQLWYGLYQPVGTNNTAELNGLHHALLVAGELVATGRTAAIFCDSQYSINCVTKWAQGWSKSGWMRGSDPVKNAKLISVVFDCYEKLKGEVKIYHVNGHVGIEGNELADRMSGMAIEMQEMDLRRFLE